MQSFLHGLPHVFRSCAAFLTRPLQEAELTLQHTQRSLHCVCTWAELTQAGNAALLHRDATASSRALHNLRTMHLLAETLLFWFGASPAGLITGCRVES